MSDLSPGQWTVSIDPEVPDLVHCQFAELEESGVKVYDAYLSPDDADQLANSLHSLADELREN